MPRSGSASAVLISNINMLADHKHHASGALWSTRWSTGAGQRSEVHELRLSHRAPQRMSWRRPPTRRSRHAAGSPSCVGYLEPWSKRPDPRSVVRRGGGWGLLQLFIFPIACPVKGGTPLIKPPCASESSLIDRSAKNSLSNFVWAQGPRRSGKCHRTTALVSGCWFEGCGSWTLVLRSLWTD